MKPARFARLLFFALSAGAACLWAPDARAVEYTCSGGVAYDLVGKDQTPRLSTTDKAIQHCKDLAAKGIPNAVGAAAQPPAEGFCTPPASVSEYKKWFLEFCWYCEPFKKLMEVIPPLSKSTFEALRKPLTALLAAGFLVWLAFHTLIKMGSGFFKGGSIGEAYYSQIIAGAFRVIVAAMLLNAGMEWLWEYTVNLVGSIGLSLAEEIVGSTKGANSGTGGDIVREGSATGACVPTSLSGTTGFPYIIARMGNILQSFNCALMDLIASGTLLFKYSFIVADKSGGCNLPQFSMLLAGVLMMLFGIALVIRAPLKLVDAMFQLVIVAVLLPMAVVAWVFPSTRGFAKNIFNLLVGALGMFITMAVMLAVVIGVLNYVMGIGAMEPDLAEWAKEFSWDSINGDNPNILVAIGAMWLCYQGFGTVGQLNAKLFEGVLSVGAGAAGDKLAKGTVAVAGAVAGAGAHKAYDKWKHRNDSPPPPPPDPPVRAYRDDRKAEQKTEAWAERFEKENGRAPTARERTDRAIEENTRLNDARTRQRNHKAGINDAMDEAQEVEWRANLYKANRNHAKHPELHGLTDAEIMQKAQTDIDAEQAAKGKTDADMDYRTRTETYDAKTQKKYQDAGGGDEGQSVPK
ncbi:hypothetical protein FACS1894186_2130 [Alphaproteobacteria bacterium]|nr:hypothetical protein FACS1894186_2130 [Alphaproteobacteria bacterium]